MSPAAKGCRWGRKWDPEKEDCAMIFFFFLGFEERV